MCYPSWTVNVLENIPVQLKLWIQTCWNTILVEKIWCLILKLSTPAYQVSMMSEVVFCSDVCVCPSLLCNRGFSKWNPGSLSAWQNYNNVEMILISEFVISEIRIKLYKNCLKWSLFLNSWIQKYESLWHLGLSGRLPGFHFEKPIISC